MGKPKQQRTKGNLQPASSSRAAELSNFGGSSNPFSFQNLGGFAQFAGSLPVGSPTPEASETAAPLATDLEPGLLVIVKKILKRDAITKLKALEELQDYLKQHPSSLPTLVPTWARLYVKLTIDVDRRVRLATNNVHQMIAVNAKKKLAPFLKEIIGAWIITTLDPSKDVARAATDAFEACFAEDKRQGVLEFCQRNILEYVTEMLLEKTPETLSDPRYVSKEDMNAKFARVVSSSFQCISLLLDKIPLDERGKCLDQYEALLDSTILWKYLSHNSAVIRTYVYNLLKALWLQWNDIIVPRLPTIIPQFINSAFAEKDSIAFSEMWDAWLLISKGYPDMWKIASKKKSVLPKLYNYLRNALNGAVAVGYPSLIVLLAYLPEELRGSKSFYQDFFSNFWEGLSSEYIDRSNAHIFLNAYTECLIFAATRQSHEEKRYLVEEVFYKLLQSFLNGGKEQKLEPGHAGIIAKHFISLASNDAAIDYLPGLYSKVENLLIMTITDCVSPDKRPVNVDVFCESTSCLLVECASNENNVMLDTVNDWSKRALFAALTSVLVHRDHAFALLFLAVKLCSRFLTTFSEQDQEQLANQGKLLLPHLTSVGVKEESTRIFVDFYMTLVEFSSDRKDLWMSAMEQLRSIAEQAHKAFVLALFLEKLEYLPITADIGQCVLDDTCQEYCQALANENIQNRPLIEQVNAHVLISHISRGTLSDKVFATVLDTYTANIGALALLRYVPKDGQGSLEHVIQPALSSLRVIQRVFTQNNGVRHVFSMPEHRELASVLFDTNFVKRPSEDGEQELWNAISEAASAIWEIFAEQLPRLDNREELANVVINHVKDTIMDVSYISSPSENANRIEKCLWTFYPERNIHDMISAFTGDEKYMRRLEMPFVQKTANYLMLSILDPFANLMTASLVDEDELMPIQHDPDGLSAYGRLIFSVAELLTRTNEMKESSESIALLLLLDAVECRQGVQLAGVSRIWDYRSASSWTYVNDFIQHADIICTRYIQSITKTASMRDVVLTITSSGAEGPSILLKTLVQFLTTPDEINSSNVAAAKLFSDMLKTILELLGPTLPAELSGLITLLKAEARELNLAGKVAVLSAIKDLVGQDPQYRNLQSDLASKLSGISSIQEFDDEQGRAWNLLVLLNASSLEFGGLCMPSQRLLHLLRTLRSWYNEDATAEQDLPLHRRSHFIVQLSQLFGHLAQSLQDVSAGQWEFFLNKSYEWIAYADTTVEEELPIVFHALKLLDTLRSLSDDTEDLHETFQARANDFYKLLLRLFAKVSVGATSTSIKSVPFARYQELVADLLEYVPEKVLLEASSVPEICALLKEKNQVLQKRAYKILQKHISYTVQDTAVRLELSGTTDEEDASKVQIEEPLFNLLISTPDISFWHSAPFGDLALNEVLGYMLSWLLLFEHFQDITFRLKQEYTQQLKNADALVEFMPFLSKILGVGAGQSIETFDLAPWDVAFYDIEGFEASVETSYLLLAAHLYYRALKHIPSLVRQWWLDCKNRQLTIGIESFTEKNFSTNLIRDELDLLSREDIKSTLEDNENDFTIKALRAASEVSATYRVDEQNMQIAIKYPKNFPLRQIDVEGVQKVGVSDRQWRGWMFSVAAVIGAQNGNIVDALTVFKRNVNLHFEGVEDCTICYSIISAQDRSIPGKQCRTCKNKFHASCLYKWFRSSNSASCPLCRTVF